MNVASCRKLFLYVISVLVLLPQILYPMILDNRYFPWLPHLYTGSNHNHAYVTAEAFFITGGDGFINQSRANVEESIISFPELWGMLDITKVAKSLLLVGKKNPIPVDWQWLSEFNVGMSGSLQGQGLMLEGWLPITKHFGIGASMLLMRLNSHVVLVPSEDSVSKLYLNSPGNQALFCEMLSTMYKELDIRGTSDTEFGPGDILIYGNIFDVHEYRYKFRTIDWGLWLGVIVPTGVKRNPDNLASVPYGGNGLWGWFVAPSVEFELRDDLKLGFQGRITKRISKSITSRIPINGEQPLFAPIVGKVYEDSGTTFSAVFYGVAEDLRGGFGIQGKYTLTYHAHDRYSACLRNEDVKPNFYCMNYYSGWLAEYFSIRVVYDAACEKPWKTRPVYSFEWDIPLNRLGGRGFAKTNRISLGCTVNF